MSNVAIMILSINNSNVNSELLEHPAQIRMFDVLKFTYTQCFEREGKCDEIMHLLPMLEPY